MADNQRLENESSELQLEHEANLRYANEPNDRDLEDIPESKETENSKLEKGDSYEHPDQIYRSDDVINSALSHLPISQSQMNIIGNPPSP